MDDDAHCNDPSPRLSVVIPAKAGIQYTPALLGDYRVSAFAGTASDPACVGGENDTYAASAAAFFSGGVIAPEALISSNSLAV